MRAIYHSGDFSIFQTYIRRTKHRASLDNMGKQPKLSQGKKQKKAAIISKFCDAIHDNQDWKDRFSVHAQNKRIVFRKSLAADNMGPLINLVATVLSKEGVDPLVVMYIAGNSMGWAFKQSDHDSKPLQNSPEDIDMIYNEVTRYLVDGNKVTDTFGNAILFLEYYLQHDWDGLGNDTVAKQENMFKEHFVVVLTQVKEKLGGIKGLRNQNQQAVERSAFCETIASTDLREHDDYSRRLAEVREAGTFTEDLKKTGQTGLQAFRKLGNDAFSDESLEEYAATLQSFDTHKAPPQPQMRERTDTWTFRNGLAKGVINFNQLNRLTNPYTINPIRAAAMQTEMSVQENKDEKGGYTLVDAHNRMMGDLKSILTNEMPDGNKVLKVNDAMLNSVGFSQQMTSIWSASQVEHLKQVRLSIQKTRQHNNHPIFMLPLQIRKITHLQFVTVLDQRKAIERKEQALPYKKSTKIARMIEQMKDVDDEQQATYVADTVMSAIMSRNTALNPHLTSKDPANVADYQQFVLNHLQAQMVFFSLGMPVPPNMWHGANEPQFDMAEFKDPQIQEFTKNWGVLTTVLNFGSRIIAQYAALNPEDKKESKTECGLSLLRFSRLWQPVTYIILLSGKKMLDTRFIKHTITFFANIPMRFIAGKFADALSEDAEMMNNVRYVLDVMVTEDFSNFGRVVGISTWKFMAEFIGPEIETFMQDPDAYKATAKAFKAPKAKKAKPNVIKKYKKGTMALKKKIKKQSKAPRKALNVKDKKNQDKKPKKEKKDKKKGKKKDKKKESEKCADTTTAYGEGSYASFFPSSSSQQDSQSALVNHPLSPILPTIPEDSQLDSAVVGSSEGGLVPVGEGLSEHVSAPPVPYSPSHGQ